MIEYFNDVEVRGSGIIMSSVFEQVKKMYAMDPEMAGELAISAIELVLTGQISSDDAMIDMLLAPAKVINDHNVQRYEIRKEGSKNKKIKDMKLDEIAEMLKNGMKQKEIAERLHISQQTVSYRMGVIRTQYPELMQDRGTETAQTILPKFCRILCRPEKQEFPMSRPYKHFTKILNVYQKVYKQKWIFTKKQKIQKMKIW